MVRTGKTANVSLPKSKVKKQDCFCKKFYVILKSLCLTGNDSALCKKKRKTTKAKSVTTRPVKNRHTPTCMSCGGGKGMLK